MNPELQQLFDRERRVSGALMWMVMLILLLIAMAVFGAARLESPRAATVMKSAAMTVQDIVPPPSTNGVMTLTKFPSPAGVLLFSIESKSGNIYASSNAVDYVQWRAACEPDACAYSENIVGCVIGEGSTLFKSTP